MKNSNPGKKTSVFLGYPGKTNVPRSVLLLVLGIHLWIFLPGCGANERAPGIRHAYITLDTLPDETIADSMYTGFLSLDTLYKYYDTLQIQGEVYFIYQGDLIMKASVFQRRLMNEILSSNLEQVQRKLHKTQQDLVIRYEQATNDTIRWKKFPIRFAIRRSSFGTMNAQYVAVKENLLKAMNDWSAVCGVRFQYVADADNSSSLETFNLDFTVEFLNPGRPVREVATAFFPNDSPSMRVLRVLPLYWTTGKDRVGIFRHELGHILGFVHEHAAYVNLAPLECRQYYPESVLPSRPVVSTYDSMSVMHYFCGGAGTQELGFSKNDSLGFIKIYGKN